ncbi:MAG: sulfurtransferase TusA family protein [Deltaproteobacteria bacterium]|nr:MAG: sulfurtransferase TusA family protein [Deltaproteobacteria bacterium]
MQKKSARSEVNLVGVAWPVCLLEFKGALESLYPHGVLEVLVRDPEVVKNIITIVGHSQNKLIDQRIEGDIHRICIQKAQSYYGEH